MSEKHLMSGNEAIAHGAWEAGCTFGSGYPGTPSSEVLPTLAKLSAQASSAASQHVHTGSAGFQPAYTEWAVNEKGALEAAAGASLTGARCIVTMKHVGLNVAADPFFTLSYTGVKGGVVVLSADDPQMHSSQNEQDNRQYARAAKVPMLEPADAQEALDFTKLAFELSERHDTPVLLRVTTRLAHSDGVVITGEREQRPPNTAPTPEAEKYVMIPARARARRRVIAERTAALRAWNETAPVNQLIPGSPEIGIIAAGIAYQYAREVAPEASFLKLGMTWPLPEQLIRSFAATVRQLFVIEELDPYLTESIRALGVTVAPLPESLQIDELSPARVREALRGVLPPAPSLQGGATATGAGPAPAPTPASTEAPLPARPPQLCPGCPHRGVFHTLRKLKVFVDGDIGCYTLGTLPPLQALHTCLCMGGGIGMVHGINQACGGKQKAVAVIGDSTFMHSGMTGLLNIVYNQSPSVVIILDNSTTAMTGGQDHPGTGTTLPGRPGGKVDLEALCRGAGVAHVQVFEPADLQATEAAVREALDTDGPAVLIARRPCVLITRDRGPVHAVDETRCIQCGACLRLGCPAISARTLENGKQQPAIDAALCTGCTLCAQVCPKSAIGEAQQ